VNRGHNHTICFSNANIINLLYNLFCLFIDKTVVCFVGFFSRKDRRRRSRSAEKSRGSDSKDKYTRDRSPSSGKGTG
jgi:hypothetical protein